MGDSPSATVLPDLMQAMGNTELGVVSWIVSGVLATIVMWRLAGRPKPLWLAGIVALGGPMSVCLVFLCLVLVSAHD